MTPFEKLDKDLGAYRTFPCGKCPVCVSRRTSQWSFRLMQQDKVSKSSVFLTLTYDTDNVPITKKGFMSLSKKDLQNFFKRLRKSQHISKEDLEKGYGIKYYAVGEYGSHYKRPHYHVILFNADILKIEKSWKHGSIHLGSVTGASVGYTLKYISKPVKITGDWDDRQKVFSCMSKRLGANYLTKSMVKWHKDDVENRCYVNVGDGKKAAMPRYFKEKIYDENEREKIVSAYKKTIYEKEIRDIGLGRTVFASIDAAVRKQNSKK